MRSVLNATALLGGSSVVAVVVGIVTAKVWAVQVGPAGLGLLGLAYAVLSLLTVIAGFGMGAGLVRFGAPAAARGDSAAFYAYYLAAMRSVVVLGVSVGVAMLILWEPVSRVALGGLASGWDVAGLQVALIAALVTSIQVSAISANHRVRALALNSVVTSAAAGAIAVAGAVFLGQRGVVPAVLGSALVSALVSRYFMVREVPGRGNPPIPPSAVGAAARALRRFGGPYTASLLVGQGVLILMPALVLNVLGAESVGFYRASVTISVGYFGFMLTAMAQDYYPRISAASERPVELTLLINRQGRLVLLLTTPVILGALALSSFIVPILYSPEFAPAGGILEWQLVGELFRFLSWTLAFVVLAGLGQRIFFLIELAAGSMLLGFSWVGMRLYGEAGLGVAYTLAYAAYFALVWFVLRGRIGFVWVPGNRRLILAGVGVVLLARLLRGVGSDVVVRPTILALAAAACYASVWLFRRELRLDQDTSTAVNSKREPGLEPVSLDPTHEGRIL